MKILLVTESWDLTTGPYESLYPFYHNILTAHGHEVRVVDNKKNYLPIGGATMWDYQRQHRRLRLPRFNNRIVNRRLRQAAQQWQPDLILLFKCENIFSQTIDSLRRDTQAVIFNWDHDNPFWSENTSVDLLRSIRLIDGFGIWAKHLFPALYSIGCQRVEYLPMFFNVERFRLQQELSAEEQAHFSSDMAFVGNGSPERAEMLRNLLDFDLAIWGHWEWLSAGDPLRSKVRGSGLHGRDYARALRSTKIGINVMNMQCRMASNTRTFEVTGLGRLLLTEYSREQAEELFIEDKEIVCFRSPEELRDKASYYLTHNAERERIAKAGQIRTLHEHTLEHRLQRIVEVAEEIQEQKKALYAKAV